MARTRLRGLEIAGIQIGIEVPEVYDWEWPEGPVAEYRCFPYEPEVHVGVRVGTLTSEDLGGERYAVGSWTFEVARQQRDWQLGLSRGGRRVQLAHFDDGFRTGEVIVSPEFAERRAYPLEGPLEEWIVLQRTVARGGLCIIATAEAVDGGALLRLGASLTSGRRACPDSSLLGRHTVLVREEQGLQKVFRAPWSTAIDGRLGSRSLLREVQAIEPAPVPFDTRLDPIEAAERIVTYAVVPLCDETLLDGVLRNAQRIARNTPLRELGRMPAKLDSMNAWRAAQQGGAFATPPVW